MQESMLRFRLEQGMSSSDNNAVSYVTSTLFLVVVNVCYCNWKTNGTTCRDL